MKSKEIDEVPLFLGTGHATKWDEFSEWFQKQLTAVDPHPPPLRMVPIYLEIMCMHFILSGFVPPCIFSTISIKKKLQHNFPKIVHILGCELKP